MRKALIAVLMAATAATPLAAQDGSWHGRGHGDGEQRSQQIEDRVEARQQRQEARQAQRVERQEAQPQQVERQQFQQQRVERVQTEQRVEGRSGGWGGRREFQQQAPAQVQVQQQAQVRSERWQGGNGGNWGGDRQRREDANANRFAAEREASRRGLDQTVGGSFLTRQAAENERRYEQQTLRREQQGQRRWDGTRDGRRWDGNRNNWSGQRFDRHSWNRSWRNDNRYDWQRYRYQNRSIFSLGRYYAPYGGYGYNRLNIGIILGEAFFGRDYWVDPYYYHLPPAPPGTEWVRYYNDVVLVDVYSGEVVDVIYDFFW